MKNTLKTIITLVLVGVMMFTTAAVADGPAAINEGKSSAAPTLATSNDTGVAGTWTTKDTAIPQARNINIVKELLSYNATSTSVYAPAFTYVYTVTPAEVSNLTVTDQKTDHVSDTAVEAPVRAGITTGLVVTGTAAGTAGDATSAVGTLVFTNDTKLTTSAEGATNSYNIILNFANVAFTQPGVYRYQIAETLAESKTYDGIAIKDATGTNPNTRWLDVYVAGNDSDNDEKLDIYGYVCMAANDSVTPNTTKTNGFVTGSNGADEYYTYDLELSKDVVNDTYAETNHAYPFTVIFNNKENYNTTFRITETAANGSTGFGPNAHTPDWRGVAKVKDGAIVTYTGIPAGVDVDVYETNDVNGVTYTVTTSVNNGTAVQDDNVSWGSTPSSAAAQAETKAAYESSKATVDTTKTTAVDAKQTVAITNTLLLISPTGVTLRFAPYILILAAGIVLLLVSRRRKSNIEK